MPNHLITYYVLVWSYIIFTSYDLMPSSSPSASLGVLIHRRADILGWEYSSSTNSLGIQQYPPLTPRRKKIWVGKRIDREKWWKNYFLLGQIPKQQPRFLHKQSTVQAQWLPLSSLLSFCLMSICQPWDPPLGSIMVVKSWDKLGCKSLFLHFLAMWPCFVS